MAYPLAVLKYRAVVNPSEVFEIDLASGIPSNSKNVFFLNDFLNPEILSPNNKITSSELILKISDIDEVKVDKNYQGSSVTISLNDTVVQQTFFSLLSEKTKTQIDLSSWSKLVIDCVKMNISTPEQLTSLINVPVSEPKSDVSSLVAKAAEGLTKEEADKLVRLRETNLKIATMDKEVGSYQNQKKDKEEFKKKKEEADRAAKAIEDKLSSVNMLIQSQERLRSELTKFNTFTSDPSVKQKVDLIKENRSSKLFSALKTTRTASGVNMEEEEKESSLLVAKWMLILAVGQVIASLILFVLTLQLIQLLIGLFSAIVIVVLMLLVNVSRYSYEYKKAGVITSNEITSSAGPVIVRGSQEEDKLMVNYAWGKALTEELSLITETINSRLGGKTLEEITKEKEVLLAEQKKFESQLSEMDTKSINTEEYYKKRRELDILKIEKENIEFSLEGKIKPDIEEQIAALTSNKTEPSVEVGEVLPLILVNCGFLDKIGEMLTNLKLKRQVIAINLQ